MNENAIIEVIPEVIETKPIPKNISYANSLRKLADFYEKHEEMFLPDLEMKVAGTATKEDLEKCAKAMGTFKKEYDDTFIYLIKKFGDISLKVFEYRQKTCERIVVGTRKIIKEIPIATQTVEVEEEIVEWKCKDTSLLNSEVKQLS